MCPLPVSVGLPPVRIFLADDMEYVTTLEGDTKLMTRYIQVIIRGVGEVSPVVEHRVGTVIILRTCGGW